MLALLRGGVGSRLMGALAVLGLMAAAGAILLTLLPADDVRAGPTGTIVRVSPAAQSVSAGTEIAVEIRIDNVSNLGAYEFKLMYEPSVVGFVSVTNGPFLTSTGRTVSCLGPLLTVDTVFFGCATVGATGDDFSGANGSGLLATVRLSTSCAGTSLLQLVDGVLGDAFPTNETVISFERQDGSVTITGAACPTPTQTPTATHTVAPTHTPTPTHTTEPTATPTAVATVTPGGPPTATPTASPIATSAPTWTPGPTWTPAPTWTPVPTWTLQPLPTSTPMQLQLLVGDANCSGTVDPVDAAVILQWRVGLAAVLPCPADANGDSALSILDATVILQYTTGLVSTLPP